jgi:hypothetical protein
MDIMLIFLSICLLYGGIGLYAAFCNWKTERRAEEARGRLDPVVPEVHITGREFAVMFAALLFLSLVCVPVQAQEVVHARAGQVIAVNAAAHTLTLKTADGSTLLFQDMVTPGPDLSFDKALREKTVPAGTFNKVGSHVVVFYFGLDNPTAVAVKELGSDGILRRTGSVANFDRHQHMLTLRSDTAGPQKLVLTEDTVVDTSNGVVKLSDYHPSKGDQLRCFTKPESQTALFVAPN